MELSKFSRYITITFVCFALTVASGSVFEAEAQQQQPQQPQQPQQQPPAQQQEADGDDVVTVVSESEDHQIFAQLLDEAGIAETLRQPGSFTVLAPTDDALEGMGEELDQIREQPQQVQTLVLDHVYQGEVNSSEIEQELDIEVAEGDIESANGVVHKVDEVVEPAEE